MRAHVYHVIRSCACRNERAKWPINPRIVSRLPSPLPLFLLPNFTGFRDICRVPLGWVNAPWSWTRSMFLLSPFRKLRTFYTRSRKCTSRCRRPVCWGGLSVLCACAVPEQISQLRRESKSARPLQKEEYNSDCHPLYRKLSWQNKMELNEIAQSGTRV